MMPKLFAKWISVSCFRIRFLVARATSDLIATNLRREKTHRRISHTEEPHNSRRQMFWCICRQHQLLGRPISAETDRNLPMHIPCIINEHLIQRFIKVNAWIPTFQTFAFFIGKNLSMLKVKNFALSVITDHDVWSLQALQTYIFHLKINHSRSNLNKRQNINCNLNNMQITQKVCRIVFDKRVMLFWLKQRTFSKPYLFDWKPPLIGSRTWTYRCLRHWDTFAYAC